MFLFFRARVLSFFFFVQRLSASSRNYFYFLLLLNRCNFSLLCCCVSPHCLPCRTGLKKRMCVVAFFFHEVAVNLNLLPWFCMQCFNAIALRSSWHRKAGVGGGTRKSRTQKSWLVDGVMTSQPHALARECQATHNAHVERDVTRGMKWIKNMTLLFDVKVAACLEWFRFMRQLMCL